MRLISTWSFSSQTPWHVGILRLAGKLIQLAKSFVGPASQLGKEQETSPRTQSISSRHFQKPEPWIPTRTMQSSVSLKETKSISHSSLKVRLHGCVPAPPFQMFPLFYHSISHTELLLGQLQLCCPRQESKPGAGIESTTRTSQPTPTGLTPCPREWVQGHVSRRHWGPREICLMQMEILQREFVKQLLCKIITLRLKLE